MSLPMFRISPEDMACKPGDRMTLTGDEGRHAVTVKRIRPGERILVGDGCGTQAVCTVADTVGKNQLHLSVESVQVVPKPTPHITVIQAIPKGDRAELAVDLCTQAGVDCLVPWQSDRTIVHWTGTKAARGREKWQRTAVESAKQSRRAWDPIVEPLAHLDEVLHLVRNAADNNGVVVVLHEDATARFDSVFFAHATSVVLVVGPEGGLTDKEVAAVEQAGGKPVMMGPTVLCSFLAGAVALGALGVLAERW